MSVSEIKLPVIVMLFLLSLSSHAQGVQQTIDTTSYRQSLIKFKQGKRGQQFLKTLALQADLAKDESNAFLLANEYLKGLKSPQDSIDAELITLYTQKSSDPGYKFLLKDSAWIDKKLGNNRSINSIMFVIYKQEIEKELTSPSSNPKWDDIEKRVVKKFGDPGQEIVWKAKAIYFYNKNDWKEFVPQYDQYLAKYGKHVWSLDKNNYAWAVFLHVNDTNLLTTALSWSRQTLDEGDDPQHLDTYANLLYKLGQTDRAIKLEEQVVERIAENVRPEYQAVLEKMKKGEKTWE